MRQVWCVVLAAALIMSASLSARAEFKASWDRVANIRDAAERIGRLQRAKGASAVYSFIDACYRTQGLSEKYGAGFEGCIAQDYIQTKMMARIYTRVEPEVLKKLGAPSAEALAHAMGQRISAAFGQYKVPAAYMEDFKKLVDEHGMPAFVKIVFPNAEQVTPEAPAEKLPPSQSEKN